MVDECCRRLNKLHNPIIKLLIVTGSAGIGATPTPALKAPPGPVRQLSGAFSPTRTASGPLMRANSSGPGSSLARATSGAFSPPARTASLGGAGSGSFGSEGALSLPTNFKIFFVIELISNSLAQAPGCPVVIWRQIYTRPGGRLCIGCCIIVQA